ncbi:MAG: glycine zipper 2TM domain-containing protein [Pseudomonadales bacterium]|nr:glycine zipper 2TM domain-containing protein [Pseudomonadales bacterium]
MKIQFALRSMGSVVMLAYLTACSPQLGGSTASAAPAASVRDVCSSCGVVESISPVTQEGRTTGAGAVIGAVVGGVAGNQVGGGSGKKVATAAGVIGGALLGNNIEQNRNTVTDYDVVITMQDGSQQFLTMQDPGNISPGSAVHVNGSSITLR